MVFNDAIPNGYTLETLKFFECGVAKFYFPAARCTTPVLAPPASAVLQIEPQRFQHHCSLEIPEFGAQQEMCIGVCLTSRRTCWRANVLT
jgi:hypothetical protein